MLTDVQEQLFNKAFTKQVHPETILGIAEESVCEMVILERK